MTFSSVLNEQITTGAAAAGVGATIYHGEEGRRGRKKALQRQEAAQQSAESRSLAQQRRSDIEIRRSRQRRPDIGRILASRQNFGLQGLGSTNLTGPLNTPLG